MTIDLHPQDIRYLLHLVQKEHTKHIGWAERQQSEINMTRVCGQSEAMKIAQDRKDAFLAKATNIKDLEERLKSQLPPEENAVLAPKTT